jgi:hypothetical protein
MQAHERPGTYTAIKWDGQSPTAVTIADLWGNIESHSVSGTTLSLINQFSNTISLPLNTWVISGPYWGEPITEAGAYPLTYLSDAEYQARFETVNP